MSTTSPEHHASYDNKSHQIVSRSAQRAGMQQQQHEQDDEQHELSPGPSAQAQAPAPCAPSAPAEASTSRGDYSSEDASAFECNVCLELSKEPVVTLCGHLYCWPCLYRWTQTQGLSAAACPVCKTPVDIHKVIPIYGRGSDADPREALKQAEPVPRRPAGQRPTHVQPPQAQLQQQQQSLSALLGFNFGNNGVAEPLTPEQQHQAFLSRLLLMLGSFVIMCLLLF